MNKVEVEHILSEISYKPNWHFVTQQRSDGITIQLLFTAPDAETNQITEQHGRKWLVSGHSTLSEVVQTAFLAIKTAEEHEMRERFRYRRAAVFGPHFNVEYLESMCVVGRLALDVRKEPKR